MKLMPIRSISVIKLTFLPVVAALSLCVPLAAFAQAVQFEYDLRITADPGKRAAYLKQSGEPPSVYDPVLNLIKGSMQVATVVDLVDIKKDRYHISSRGTLGSVLSTVLNNQTLIRDSVGTVTANGLLTNTYQEKRGNTDLLLAKVDAPKNLIQFFKVSSRTPPDSNCTLCWAVARHVDGGLSVYWTPTANQVAGLAGYGWPHAQALYPQPQ